MLNSRCLTLWMAESVPLVHHHLSHQHLPPYRWGELKHVHNTGVLGVSEIPLQRSVTPKLYTSFHSHQFHSGKYKIMYLTQCQVMNVFLSRHHKSLYPSCSILKQTLGSAQESKEFSNEMTEIYPHESAGFEFHSVCHHHLKFGKSVSVRFQLYLKIKNIHNKIKQDIFSYFKK